jgi:hypothetical protein
MIKGADPPEGGKLQMQKSKALFRTGLIAILILSIFLCSFATGMVQQSSIPGKQIPTVPPIVATLPTPIGGQTPVATPIPTLAPGQYFEEDDTLPNVTRPDLLEEPYGYSEIVGSLDQFLVWSTDDNGNKRYYVLNEGNQYLDKIREVVDEERRRWGELEDSNAWEEFLLNSAGTIGVGFVTAVCGIGTVASLFAEPFSAPITTIGAGCTGGGVKYTIDFFNATIDNYSNIRAYEKYKKEAAKEVEGYFIQIPFSIQD